MSVVRATRSAVHVTAGERMFSCRGESDAAGSYQTRQRGWRRSDQRSATCRRICVGFNSKHCLECNSVTQCQSGKEKLEIGKRKDDAGNVDGLLLTS